MNRVIRFPNSDLAQCCDTVVVAIDERRNFISGVGELRALALASGFMWTLHAGNNLVFELGTQLPFADAEDGDVVKFHGFYFPNQSTMFGLTLIDGVVVLCWHCRRQRDCGCHERKQKKHDCGCGGKKKTHKRCGGDVVMKVKAEAWC